MQTCLEFAASPRPHSSGNDSGRWLRRLLLLLVLMGFGFAPLAAHATCPSSITVTSSGSFTFDNSSCTDGIGAELFPGNSFSETTAHGSVSLSTNTLDITYTNNGDSSKTDSFVWYDDNGNPQTVSVTIGTPTVTPVTISPTTAPTGTLGQAYSLQFTASGGVGAPYTYVIDSGQLPAGVTDNGSGLISGTPTESGSFTFTESATDQNGNAGQQVITLTINGGSIVIAPSSLPNATAYVAYNQTLTASGGTAPYTFTQVPGTAPPAGITIGSNGSLTGTVTALGTTNFSVKVTDNNNVATQVNYSLQVVAPTIIVSPASLPSGEQGNAYSQTLSASGGTAPYIYAVTTGTLPGGMTLSSAGVLSGTPTGNGTSTFTLTATDAHSFSGAHSNYSLAIVPPVPTLNAIFPSSGPTVGGTAVTLTGTNFTGATGVSFGGNAAASITIISATSITAVTPAGSAGTASVLVTTPGGTNNANSLYTYVAPPTVSAISPNTGPTTGGTLVTLTGTNFTGATGVTIGGTAATSITVISATSITATTPAHSAGTASVLVTTSGGTNSANSLYTYVAPPTANSVSATVAYSSSNNPITLSLGGGAATSVAVATAAGHGTATSSGTSITYTPTAGYAGLDSFTYTATNAAGTSGQATVSLTIASPTLALSPASLPAPTAETSYSQTFSSGGGTAPYTYAVSAGALPMGLSLNSATGVLSGTPTSAGSYPFTIRSTDSSTGTGAPFAITHSYTLTVNAPNIAITPATLPAAQQSAAYTRQLNASGGNGTYTFSISAGSLPAGVTLSSTGLLSGTPTANGSFPFTVIATDDLGFTGSQSYTLTVNLPLVPTAAAKSVTTAYNTAASINLTSSITGVDIASVQASNPTHGTVSVSGETVTYTPSSTYYGGSDSFTYTATNPGGTSSPATVTITVGAPAVPTVAAKSAGTAYNTAASIDLTSSITGVDITAVTIGTAPTHGTVSVSGETVTYTPSSTYYGGSDSFTYTATNPGGTSAPATVTITVGAPTIPAVAAKSVSTPYNTATSIDLTSSITGVDISAVTIGTAPTHGTATVVGDVVTYTPSASYYGGTDSFTYTATNPGGTSSAATVTITVGAPAKPTVAATNVSTPYNTAASINLSASITGVDVTAVTIGIAPTHGTVSVSGETVTYTPSSTYYGGSDSFTYTATNPGGTSSPATVTITVGAPVVPTVAAKSVTTAYNTAVSINLTDSITGVDITAVTIGTAPTHGTVSVTGEMVTYTPSSTYYGGSDSFTYTATNPGGISSAAMVTITVTPLSVPVAAAISVATTIGTPVSIQATTGAIGPPPLTGVSVASAPAHGSASASGEQITYIPTAGFVGTDTLTYQVGNHFGSSAPATITVTVTAAGRASASGGTRTVTTMPATPVSVNLATIVPGNYVSAAIVGFSPGNAGSNTLSQPATLTFTSTAAFRGLAQITAVLTSSTGSTVTVDVLVLVSSQPNPSKNPDVLGLVNAQTEQAQRFAQSQLDNIDRRLESLHDGGGTALFSNDLSVSLDGLPMQAPPPGTPPGTSMLPSSNPRTSGNAASSSASWMRPGIGASDSMGDAPTSATASDSAQKPARGPNGLGVWIGGTANFGAFDAYRQASGFDSDSVAVNMGVDQRLGQEGLIGFSLGYDHDNSVIANDGTRSIAQGYSAAFYGSFQPSAQTYVDALLGGGELSFDSRRFDDDTGSYLTGQRNGSAWFGSITGGYEYHVNRWLLSPYGRLEWSSSALDGFSENGAVTGALSYGNQTVRTSLAVLGLRASGQIQLDSGTLLPHARLEIGHDFQGTSNTTLSYTFIPSAGSWDVLTNPYSANGTSAQLGFGADLQLRTQWLLTTEYDYLAQPHARDQEIHLGISKQF